MPDEKILVVDDEENIRHVLSLILTRKGFQVQTAAEAQTGLEALASNGVSLIISDIRLPGMDGIEFLRRIRSLDEGLPVIMMTAFGTVESAIEAMKAGATDYLSKPIKADEIVLCVNRALDERRLRAENVRLRREVEDRYSFHNLVGKSRRMQAVYDQIEKIAPHRTPVLVTGESGTGKELIARAIHYNSPRRTHPLVAVNCAAITSTLIESELFGHVRGSFTDAVADKVGFFEAANGGTLFLDEIGEVPLSSQPKLLRVLQEQEVVRVGDTRVRKVDVRVVAATVRDLPLEVKEGRFREDLFYRLSVVPVRLPPLRERKEDIPLLVEHFLRKVCRANQMSAKRMSAAALERLVKFDWPGNVRQLENTIERAIVLADSDVIQPEALSAEGDDSEQSVSVFVPEDLMDLKTALRQVTEVLEKTLLERALQREGSNRTRAARLLGISHRCLMYKIKEYGLEDA
ncbi:MAG: sigma-54-dependent Fis family transcriptional regulator [Candidatus Schekmanbacteria bacterium]|nr:sigma-54-dependent Fis family transcriptional regulator [Candidatus Schekmanbacteria bacterium]